MMVRVCKIKISFSQNFFFSKIWLLSIALCLFFIPFSTSYGDEKPLIERHATSLIGEPSYPRDFQHFSYVHPDAPKGGLVRQGALGSFDSLNFVPSKGEIPTGLGLIYDSLMTSSMDEPSTMYGLLAESLHYPDDYSYVIYILNDKARWHDGRPVTTEDVVWSFNVLKEHNPQQAFYYSHVLRASALDKKTIRFDFDQKGNRELPHIVGQLLIMPKHWWTAENEHGQLRDISRGTLEPPLSSGPYRVQNIIAGRSITYERVDTYWGKDLNVNIGRHNFGAIRYDYYRDDAIALEAFKAGDLDWRSETTAKNWAQAYNIPALEQGRIKKELFDNAYRTTGVMSGFVPNLRKPLFQNTHVRRGLNAALHFEAMNKSLFFNQYQRIDSYFYGLDLASQNIPSDKEQALLRKIYNQLDSQEQKDFPQSIFNTKYENPMSSDHQAYREQLKQALASFEKAGWTLSEEIDDTEPQGFLDRILVAIGLKALPKKKIMRDEKGQPVSFEFLINSPAFERVGLFYKQNLERLGIEMRVRLVDSAQYAQRLRIHDFDMVYAGWGQSISPGNEQKDFFGSQAASRQGSRNYGGISNRAVDLLIDEIIFAKERSSLETAVKAFDRVLLHHHFIIPGWTLRSARIARWDIFDHPRPLPSYDDGFPSLWWIDQQKAHHLNREKP